MEFDPLVFEAMRVIELTPVMYTFLTFVSQITPL
jgi:hypothetical protein